MYENELYHHGILGQRWGVRNGPPYPLKVHQNIFNRAFGKLSGHYGRQKLNVGLPKNEREAKRKGWTKLSDKASAMHQYNQQDGVKNSKWISPDGHREVVYTGKGKNQHITHDPRDVGTYNYYSHKQSIAKHAIYDVIPYLLVGNSKYDSTTKKDRLVGTVRGVLGLSPSSVNNKHVSKGKKRVDNMLKRKKRR